MDSQQKELDIKQIVQVALTIATRRRELLLQLRKALEESNTAEIITLAKELCGFS